MNIIKENSSYFFNNVICLILCFIITVLLKAATVGAAPPGSERGIEKYVITTVYSPVVDGMDLSIPDISVEQPNVIWGYLDITKPPFFADPTGIKDSTTAIQNAINYSRDHQLACFFPSGTYLISDTLRCIQNYYKRSNGHVYTARLYPNLLIGSRAGKRPKILLANNSKGFDNPMSTKRVIEFLARKATPRGLNPNKFSFAVSFDQMFTNIDIVIGKGNPGAVGIYHCAAQGSGIEDCTIDATCGHTGIEGGIGAGGSFTNVSIVGGKIGMNLSMTDVAPTITGIKLYGQTESAIIYQGMNTLTAVGLKVKYSGSRAAIKSLKAPCCLFRGPMSIIDSCIECENEKAVGIHAQHSLYLKNIYIINAKTAVKSENKKLFGDKDKTILIKEYVDSANPISRKPHLAFLPYTMPIYQDGKVVRSFDARFERPDRPPSDLLTRHIWEESFPHFEMPNAVNVKLQPYNARGDGIHDDTQSLQKAIDENETVFLPKGYYLVNKSLKLKKNTKLIGIGRHLSIILCDMNFSRNGDENIVLSTADDSTAETILYHIGIFVPSEMSDVIALKWRSGPRSFIRDINIINYPIQGFSVKVSPVKRSLPLTLISGNGAGRIYNLYQGRYQWHASDYSHVIVNNIKGPLNFYQLNMERSRGEANFEVINSKNIAIMGLKGEGNKPIVLIKKSDNISIYGYGGNAAAMSGGVLFKIIDSNNIQLTNIVDTPRITGGNDKTSSGIGIHPKFWNMISWEENENEKKTNNYERPVLFRLGKPVLKTLPPAAKIQ